MVCRSVPVQGSGVPTMRVGFSVAAIGDVLYCFGGSGNGKCSSDLFAYRVGDAAWERVRPSSKAADGPSPRTQHASLTLRDGFVVHGGAGLSLRRLRAVPAE